MYVVFLLAIQLMHAGFVCVDIHEKIMPEI